MTAAAVALTDFGQVDRRLGWSPRIRTYGNFYPKAALAQAHAVNRFRMQIVRHELVVALEVVVRDIKKQSLIDRLDALFQHRDGARMAFQQGRQERSDE